MTAPATTGGAKVVPIPPPAYYAAAFATGLLLQQMTPLDFGHRRGTTLAGAAVLAAGLALAGSGVAGVIAHRTTVVPHHEVSRLVTNGIYRISRNPMYTGLAVMVAGGALIAGTWWPLITLPASLLAVRRLAIAPEEAYLSARFGAAYADYCGRTRRWL